jgi:uncharacterized protein
LIYVDTSVLAAYYCPEPLSARAQRVLQGEPDLAVSSLVEVELASAMARKVRTREISEADGRRLYTAFRSHLEQGMYTRLAVQSSHFAKAQEWLATFRVPLLTLDALHIAVAATEGVNLLTADTALARACTKVGVRVRLITQATRT